MNEANPYTAPDASLAREQDELYQPKIFSFGGRIGRLRYLAYGIGTSIILMAVMMPILAGTMFASGFAGGEQTMSALTIVAMVVFYGASIVRHGGAPRRFVFGPACDPGPRRKGSRRAAIRPEWRSSARHRNRPRGPSPPFSGESRWASDRSRIHRP